MRSRVLIVPDELPIRSAGAKSAAQASAYLAPDCAHRIPSRSRMKKLAQTTSAFETRRNGAYLDASHQPAQNSGALFFRSLSRA